MGLAKLLLLGNLRNGEFYIQNFMLITNIQIIVKKSSPTLNTLFHQIELVKIKSALRSNLCDYSDGYVVVKGIVTVSADERDTGEMNR